jgi:hypothetical protein
MRPWLVCCSRWSTDPPVLPACVQPAAEARPIITNSKGCTCQACASACACHCQCPRQPQSARQVRFWNLNQAGWLACAISLQFVTQLAYTRYPNCQLRVAVVACARLLSGDPSFVLAGRILPGMSVPSSRRTARPLALLCSQSSQCPPRAPARLS